MSEPSSAPSPDNSADKKLLNRLKLEEEFEHTIEVYYPIAKALFKDGFIVKRSPDRVRYIGVVNEQVQSITLEKIAGGIIKK